jgi:hypothetical protein
MRGTPLRFTFTVSVALCALQGCATLAPLEPSNPYPSREDVRGFMEVPAVEVDVKERVVARLKDKAVDRWVLEGNQLPSGTTPVSPRDALERVVVDRGRVLSEEAQCVARELVRFRTQHRTPPSGPLVGFMGRHCGAWGSLMLQYPSLKKSAAEPYNVQRALDEFGDDITSWITTPHEKSVWRHTGIAMEQDETHLYFTVVYTTKVGLKLDGGAHLLLDDTRHVRVRGQTTFSFEGMSAFMQFPDGRSIRCHVERGLSARRVDVACPVPNQVRQGVVVLVARRYKSTWRDWQISLPYFAQRTDPKVFEPTFDPGAASEVALDLTAPDFARHMVEGINRLRVERGLEPFVHDVAQDRMVAHLEPLMHENRSGKSRSYRDYRMAIHAGWEVMSPRVLRVEEGHGFVQSADGLSVGSFLSNNPRVQRLALWPNGGQLTASLAPGRSGGHRVSLFLYESVPTATAKERARTYLETINRFRSLRGLGKVRGYKNFHEVASRLAAQVEAGETSPARARERFRQEVEDTLGHPTGSYGFFTSSLDEIHLTGALAEEEELNVATMIAPYRSANHPHTHYLVVIAFKWPESRK